MDELVEVAFRAFRGDVLIDESETAGVEFFEELVPGDLFQVAVVVVFGLGKLYAENAGLTVLFGAGDLCGFGATSFSPCADFIVVLRGFGKCHRHHLLDCVPPGSAES